MSDVFDELARLARDRLQPSAPLTPETQLVADLALDSIQQLELVVALENHFRVALELEDGQEIRTLGQLARWIERARAQAGA
jgi:acyl carrier protein